ncbi:MAG: hypothetical protein L6455_18480, partial [Kiritimatiellae bacterium]|nr:hypothetical protein [Kiritimatiellia bacterium]
FKPHSQNSQSLRGSVQQRFIPNAARKSLGSPRQRGILAALGIKRYSFYTNCTGGLHRLWWLSARDPGLRDMIQVADE